MQQTTATGAQPNQSDRQATPPPLEGYAAVAGWLALDPDGETFVFRKFDNLAARNLLCIQSELLAVEKELALLDRRDAEAARDDLRAKDTARSWDTLVSRSSAGHDGSRRRIELLESLRSKIKEYRKERGGGLDLGIPNRKKKTAIGFGNGQRSLSLTL